MEDSATLLDWLNNETTRDFLAIAFFGPLAAGLVAFVGERLGVSGKIRRLEAQEKRLTIVNGLMENTNLSPEIRTNLSAQLNDISAELVAEFGVGGHDEEVLGASADTPIEWGRLKPLRRAVFLPVPRTPFGWTLIILYYYFLFSVVVLTIGMVAGDISIEGLWFGVFAYVAIIAGLRQLLRSRYQAYVRNSTERIKYARNLLKQQMEQQV
jgi:hypothetical protein